MDAATGSREASGGGRLPPTEHCYGMFSGRPTGGVGGDLRSRRALVRTEGGPIRTGATRTRPELSDRASNRRPPRHLSPGTGTGGAGALVPLALRARCWCVLLVLVGTPPAGNIEHYQPIAINTNVQTHRTHRTPDQTYRYS